MQVLFPALLAGSLALPAAAQLPQPAAPLPFRSALDGYQRHAEQEVAPWRSSIDTVGRIGGWRAYAREAAGQPPAAADGRAAAPAPPASPAHPHRHHPESQPPGSGHGHAHPPAQPQGMRPPAGDRP